MLGFPRGSAVVRLLFAWGFFFVTYLALAGQASVDEIVAGVLCATTAVLWWLAICRASPHAFAFDSGAWAASWRACRGLPWATLCVGAVLLRTLVHPEVGETAHRAFVRGRSADAAEAGRRAVGVLAASLAPDSFVIRLRMSRDEIVVHSLTRGTARRNSRWPI